MPVASPAPVPALEAEPRARSVVSGIRTCAILMSDAADVMHASAAPRGFEGEPAQIAHHAMTRTAADLDTATAAFLVGLAALDAFCDRMDVLRTERSGLVARHAELSRAAARLRSGQEPSPAEVAAHTSRVEVFDDDVLAWSRQVEDAEHRVVAALRTADTRGEARRLTGRVDVPALVAEAARLAASPAQVRRWWLSLSAAAREALKVAHPELIGALNGIPVADRDEANRARVSALFRTLREKQADGEVLTEHDRDLLKKIADVREGLDREDVGAPTYLMLFDPEAAEGDGFGAIAFGDPETATHVSVNVPGFTTTLNGLSDVARGASRVWEAAARLGVRDVATIAWLGYDAPDFGVSLDGLRQGLKDGLGVAGEGQAEAGARRLSAFVGTLRTMHDPSPLHLTVIGHSYGSTTTAIAASRDMRSDDVVLVGSPGAGEGNDRASDLHGRVYVGSDDEDFVTHFGSTHDVSLGVDPASKAFGAHRFEVESQEKFAVSPEGFRRGAEDHGSYFDDLRQMEGEGRGRRDSVSLVNIANVVIGHQDKVGEGTLRDDSNETWWRDRLGNAGPVRSLGERLIHIAPLRAWS